MAWNCDYFYNIELLCEAIDNKVQVEFIYNSFGTDKRLHARKSEKSLVNPYQLFLKNEHYYLACNYDKYDNIAYCRIDKISNLSVTQTPIKCMI